MEIKNEMHIIPFYTKSKSVVHPEYCDLTQKVSTIRGIKCKKQPVNVPVFKDGKLTENVFYWKAVNAVVSDFEVGLDLVLNKNNKIGVGNRNSILNFIKKNKRNK